MKSCPTCNRTYGDDTLRFCLEDGTPLADARQSQVTVAAEPPPTLVYPAAPATSVSPSLGPTPLPRQKRRVWPWLVGALVVLSVLGVGLGVAIIWSAGLGSNDNSANRSVANRNSSLSNANGSTTPYNSNDNRKTPIASGEIKDVYMAQDNGSGQPGEKAESFETSDRTIHCVVDLAKAQAGTIIKFNWIGVDAGEWQNYQIKELEYTTKPSESQVRAHVSYSEDWPEGSYRVDISVNGQFARTIAFQVE